MLPDLLTRIPPDQQLGSVTADGAYDTRKCHDAIAARNAHAVIPPRKNAKLWKLTRQVPEPATMRCAHQGIWAAYYGDRSPAITVEAALKQRCIV